MTDLQDRLRDAIAASVDGEEPSFDLMAAVRRRYRRRLRRLAVAGPVSLVVVIAATVFVAVSHPPPGHYKQGAADTKPGKPRPAPVYPGGGRLLVDNGGVLSWLYPDGATIQIPGQFDGASVT